MPENVPEPNIPTYDAPRGDSSIPQGPDPQLSTPRPKSPLLATILAIILTVVAVIAIYLFLQVRALTLDKTTPSPTPTPVAVVDPTEGWEIYINTDLGFEIKHPPFMKIDKELSDENSRYASIKGQDLTVSIMLRNAPENMKFDSYYYMDNTISSISSLGGKHANVYVQDVTNSGCDSPDSGPGCPMSFVAYAAIHGSDIYHLEFYGDAILSDVEKQILSSFKFTD